MGHYALENYDPYPTAVFRPLPLDTPPHNPGYGKYLPVDAWLGPDEMCQVLLPADSPGGTVPVATTQPLGVLIPHGRVELIRAARDRGLQAVLCIWDDVCLSYARRARIDFALLLSVGGDSRLDTAQRLATLLLQRHWCTAPVYAAIRGPLDRELATDLLRWHVRAATAPLPLGINLQLRRATCPVTVSSQGALPLRLWFANKGSCPVYGETGMTLHLEGKDIAASVRLRPMPHLFLKTGDIVHNEIARIPALPMGEYVLSLWVEDASGQPLRLTQQGQTPRGAYLLGPVQIDHVARPEHFCAWDNYYPEGYYPIEDPKEPISG